MTRYQLSILVEFEILAVLKECAESQTVVLHLIAFLFVFLSWFAHCFLWAVINIFCDAGTSIASTHGVASEVPSPSLIDEMY